MKQYLLSIILCFATIFLFSGCQPDLNEAMQQISSVKTQPSLVKKYVDDNSYIELDVNELVNEIARSQMTRSVSVEQDKLAQMKAALYRFYSNVELVDDTYVCRLKSAEEINVSVDVYSALLNNLNEINVSIQEAKKNGMMISIPEVDEAYLNSLLE